MSAQPQPQQNGHTAPSDSDVFEIARTFLRATFSDQERHRRRVGKVNAIEAEHYFPTEALLRQGQSIWIDNIARNMLISGELRGLAWNDRVAGVTSNPTMA